MRPGTADGMTATRVSPGQDSFGIPTRIGFKVYFKSRSERDLVPPFDTFRQLVTAVARLTLVREAVMRKPGVCAGIVALLGAGVLAEAQRPASGKPTTYDVAITVEGQPYTGTMVLAIAGNKVSGSMAIKQPGEITGKAAGIVKGGEMLLDFPYHMVERKCDGDIRMTVKLPEKKVPGAKASGTVSIGGCGRPPDSRLPGTIELTAVAAKK
jgi:hypothetical protein